MPSTGRDSYQNVELDALGTAKSDWTMSPGSVIVERDAVLNQPSTRLSELKAKRDRLIAEQVALARLQKLKEEQRLVEEEIRSMEQNSKKS
jgi:hypothetical protein